MDWLPRLVRIGIVLAVLVIAAACTGGTETSDEPSSSSCSGRLLERTPPPYSLGEITWTHEVGKPTWYSDVDLSPEQIEELCEMELSGAFLNVVSGEAIAPFRNGVVDALEDAGIELVAEAYAEFDPAKQAADVENAMTLEPDLIVALPVDPVSGAEAYQPIVDAEICLSLGGVEPAGYTVGEDYYAQTTYDLPGLGRLVAEALAETVGGSGKVGFIRHDADFYITNTREDAALDVLEAEYPNIEVVVEPMADPATAEEIARAMITRESDIQAIFAPWAASPATGVVAAVNDSGEDVKVVTVDLDPIVALSIANGGPVVAAVSSHTYEFGYTWAVVGMQCLLGLPSPTVAILPAVAVTAENLAEQWPLVMGPQIPLPDEVEQALG